MIHSSESVSALSQNELELLSESDQLCNEGRLVEALDCLRIALADMRAKTAPAEWRTFCAQSFATHEFRRHPISRLIRTGSIGRRCAERANGSIIDPVVLDAIYGIDCCNSELDRWEACLGFCATMRSRRQVFTRELIEIGAQARYPRVLAVGCGHLREAHGVLSLNSMRGGEFFAYDSHRSCLKLIQRESSYPGLRTISGTLRDLKAESQRLGRFDLIYIPTLFDSLDDAQAGALLDTLAPMLESGGRILAANLLPQVKDAAYLEACLDCWPAYRTEVQLATLAEGAARHSLRGQAVFQEETGGSILLDFEAI